MVGLARLELATSPLSGVRSNHLSYKPILQFKVGGGRRDRTDDPLLAKQVLYQLSYAPKLKPLPFRNDKAFVNKYGPLLYQKFP
jgi:hypothetical protein